jgi:hypothetical protein
MAKIVLTGQFLTLNATNIHTLNVLKKAEFSAEVADVDVTNMGSAGWTELLGGIKSGSLSMEFFQDVAAAQIDSVMWPLLGNVVAFELRQTTSARSTSNPAYTGSCLVSGWGLEGSVGDAAMVSVEFPTSGAITRATA